MPTDEERVQTLITEILKLYAQTQIALDKVATLRKRREALRTEIAKKLVSIGVKLQSFEKKRDQYYTKAASVASQWKVLLGRFPKIASLVEKLKKIVKLEAALFRLRRRK